MPNRTVIFFDFDFFGKAQGETDDDITIISIKSFFATASSSSSAGQPVGWWVVCQQSMPPDPCYEAP